MKVYKGKRYIWQAAWWREDAERGRWLATVGLAVVLLAATALVTPGLLDEQQQTPPAVAPAVEAQAQPVAPTPQTVVEPGVEQSPAAPQPEQAVPVLAEQAEDAPPAEDGQADAAAGSAQFVLPIAGGLVTRAYGYDFNPNTEDFRFHRGCDIRAASGALALSAAAGVVEDAYSDEYWGGVVVVSHDGGWKTIYKCLEPDVQRGDRLAAGDALGQVCVAPAEAAQDLHLHVEVERGDGESVDPELFLSR